jgi:hypothetical protein
MPTTGGTAGYLSAAHRQIADSAIYEGAWLIGPQAVEVCSHGVFAEERSFLMLIFHGPHTIVASNYLVDLSHKQEYLARFKFRISGLLTEWVKLQPIYTDGAITIKEYISGNHIFYYRVYIEKVEYYYVDLSWENSSTITSRIGTLLLMRFYLLYLSTKAKHTLASTLSVLPYLVKYQFLWIMKSSN